MTSMIRTTHTYADALKAVEKYRRTAESGLRLEWLAPRLGFERRRGERVFCRVLNRAGECVREFALKEWRWTTVRS